MISPQIICDLLTPGVTHHEMGHPGLMLWMEPADDRVTVVGSYKAGTIRRRLGFYVMLEVFEDNEYAKQDFSPLVEDLVKRLVEGAENE